MKSQTTIWLAVGLIASLLVSACSTIPSCAWGKCASYQRYQALIPQTGARVYPMKYGEAYEAVKDHLVKRGYPFEMEDPVEGVMNTKPYAEAPFARFLGIKYSWQVQVRKMDTLNTEVTVRLFLHEKGKEPRMLTPGLDPEPYRYFWWKVEDSLVHITEKSRA
ncbi:MAG: hypothetical protein ACREIL_02605 [Nitrospiraceae bacterium]